MKKYVILHDLKDTGNTAYISGKECEIVSDLGDTVKVKFGNRFVRTSIINKRFLKEIN